jgi:hypothetical protein
LPAATVLQNLATRAYSRGGSCSGKIGAMGRHDPPSSEAHRPELRWGTRVPLRTLAELVTDDGDFEAVWVRNASLSGAFVETERSLRMQARVALCPTGRSGDWLDGFVVRAGDGGHGIEWVDPVLHPVSALLSLREEPLRSGLPPARESTTVSWRLMDWLRR